MDQLPNSSSLNKSSRYLPVFLIIILFTLGMLGYIIFSSKKAASRPNPQNVSQQGATAVPIPTLPMVPFTDTALNVSLQYPEPWKVYTNTNTSSISIDSGKTRIYGFIITGDPKTYIQKTYLSKYVQSSSEKTISHPLYKATEYIIHYTGTPRFSPSERNIVLLENSDNQKFLFDSNGPPDKTFYAVVASFKFSK
jgi:hypothetical protein